MCDLQMWNVRNRTKDGIAGKISWRNGTRELKSCFKDLILISSNPCKLWDKNKFYNMGNLSKFKLVNIVKSKIRYMNHSTSE